ncbi:MAG: phospholipase [Planctomycetota bacterium]
MPTSKSIRFESALLRRLHHLQQTRDDLEGQIRRGPTQIKAAQSIVDKSREKLEAIRMAIRNATMNADEKQLQLKGREDKVAGLEAKLNSAASNKEFSMLKEQIAADRQANDVLGDEILEVLEQIDQLGEQADAASAELEANEKIRVGRENAVNERLQIVKEDLAGTREKLAAEEAKIPAEAKPLYARLVNGLGMDAIAPAQGNSCGHCNQILRTQIIDDLRMQHLVQCPGCHAILYEES